MNKTKDNDDINNSNKPPSGTWLSEARVAMGQEYAWKENLMRQVQEGVRARAAELVSQEAYSLVVQSELNRHRESLISTIPAAELDSVTKMIHNTLNGIPYQIFAQ